VRKHGLRHIVLAGHGASLTSETARWLIAEGVQLTLAGRSGEAIGLLGHSPETDYSSLALAARRAQWEALLNRRRSIEIARAIVATKMERVASVLERFAVTSGGSAPSPSIVDGAFGSPRAALAELNPR
jgi:CRISPR/Cas system-associated endonuclease Cas1